MPNLGIVGVIPLLTLNGVSLKRTGQLIHWGKGAMYLGVRSSAKPCFVQMRADIIAHFGAN